MRSGELKDNRRDAEIEGGIGMIVGLTTLELRMTWSQSLKDKRSEIKSLMAKVRVKFNVAIAETECHDDRQRAVIGLAVVSTERRHVDSMLNEIISFAEQNTAAELVCSHIEII